MNLNELRVPDLDEPYCQALGCVRTAHATGPHMDSERLSLWQTRIALLMCASHCQGGHSAAGSAAATALGISFPITMSNMVRRAKDWDLDPNELWPWLYSMAGPTLRKELE